MVNSAFGKTCEGKCSRIKDQLVRDEQEALKWTSRPELKTFQVIANDLATVGLNQTEILWDKPTIVGACILDLSKKFLFEFHYKIMKHNFDCKLLYSETDALVYEVETERFCGYRIKTIEGDVWLLQLSKEPSAIRQNQQKSDAQVQGWDGWSNIVWICRSQAQALLDQTFGR